MMDFRTLILLIFHIVNVQSFETGVIKFAVLGDWGGLPIPPFYTDIERSISRKLVDVTNQLGVDFLLALGDNFYYDGVANEHDSRFKTTFEDIFNEKDLFFPWYFIAGNHDHKGNISGQLEYSKHSKRWKFPDLFYTLEENMTNPSGVTVSQLAVVMIDTVVLCGNIDSDFHPGRPLMPVVAGWVSEQYWRKLELQLIRFQSYAYVLVAGHYPVWSIGEHGPTKCLVERLDPLLKKYNVSAYLNGHDHTMEHIQVGYATNTRKMDYFTIGAANFFNNSINHSADIPVGSLRYHWLNQHREGALAHVLVTEQKMRIQFLSTGNTTLLSVEIYPR